MWRRLARAEIPDQSSTGLLRLFSVTVNGFIECEKKKQKKMTIKVGKFYSFDTFVLVCSPLSSPRPLVKPSRSPQHDRHFGFTPVSRDIIPSTFLSPFSRSLANYHSKTHKLAFTRLSHLLNFGTRVQYARNSNNNVIFPYTGNIR